jgi:hypothetical protein
MVLHFRLILGWVETVQAAVLYRVLHRLLHLVRAHYQIPASFVSDST